MTRRPAQPSASLPAAASPRGAARARVPGPLSGEVPRTRVTGLLDEAASRRLTVVTAGPGWGKTTAVAAWARETRLRDRVVWVTLTDSDDTLMAFWSAVVAAIQGRGLLAPDDVPLLHVASPDAVPADVLPAVYRLLARAGEPLVVVLDDFHRIENPVVLMSVQDLLALDQSLRLVLLTRSDAALPLHRLRLTGDLTEVDSTDLAFDVEDVVALSAALSPAAVTMSVAEQVLTRTHGWPAGVRMALLYRARRADAVDPLAGFGGSERSVGEYLLAEVIADLDPRDLEFLQRTSVADPVPTGLADAVDPDAGAAERLERLERANLFVTAADDTGRAYRYHPLLRDLLLHDLRRDHPGDYVEGHRRAAAWLARHGDPVTGLEHAVAAGDADRTLECALASAPMLVGSSRFRLHRALSSIPFDDLPESPEREITAAGLEVITGNYDAVTARLTRARRLITDNGAGAVDLQPGWRALLENLTAAAARIEGDLHTVLTAADWSLNHLSAAAPGPAVDGQRHVASAQRAVALLWLGRLPEARDLLRTPAPPNGRGPALVRAGRASNTAWCDCLLGHLDPAWGTAVDATRAAADHGWSAALQLRAAHLTIATIALLRGRLDDADRAVAHGLAATAGGVELWPQVTLHLLAALIAVSRRRPRAARAARDLAHRHAQGQSLPPTVAPIAARLDVDLALLDPSAATPAPLPSGDADHPWSLVAGARLAHARGDNDRAVGLARTVVDRVGEGTLDDIVTGVEASLVLALAADRDGHDYQAVEHLRIALAAASRSGLTRPFTTTGSDRVAPLLRRVADTGQGGAFARTVLQHCQGTPPPGAEPSPMLAFLSERELAVLSQLPTMRSNSEIAADLYVSVNTIKMHLKQIYRKLQVRNRREAVIRARDLGLIP